MYSQFMMHGQKNIKLGPYVLKSAAIFHATLRCVILSYSIITCQNSRGFALFHRTSSITMGLSVTVFICDAILSPLQFTKN